MKDTRSTDRRKKTKPTVLNRRKGPRRLVCNCGGKIDVTIASNGKETFACLRCGMKI